MARRTCHGHGESMTGHHGFRRRVTTRPNGIQKSLGEELVIFKQRADGQIVSVELDTTRSRRVKARQFEKRRRRVNPSQRGGEQKDGRERTLELEDFNVEIRHGARSVPHCWFSCSAQARDATPVHERAADFFASTCL